MRPGISSALLGALIVTACGDGASVRNAESVETTSVSEDGPQGLNDFAQLGGASLATPGNGQEDAGGLPTQQNAELILIVPDAGPDAGSDLGPAVESIILELVVRTQEEGGGPQAPNGIAAGGAEQETFSATVQIEAGSDQLSFTNEAQERLVGFDNGERALNGLVDASAENDDGISDEQDFEAVSNRETIESDAERLKVQETERREFAPTPLPDRMGDSNVALFALQTTHDVGTEVYERVRPFVFAAGVRNRCAEYPDSEAAQQAFLDAGGPERDELRIDPDGDGFVCGWDPNVYRAVLK